MSPQKLLIRKKNWILCKQTFEKMTFEGNHVTSVCFTVRNPFSMYLLTCLPVLCLVCWINEKGCSVGVCCGGMGAPTTPPGRYWDVCLWAHQTQWDVHWLGEMRGTDLGRLCPEGRRKGLPSPPAPPSPHPHCLLVPPCPGREVRNTQAITCSWNVAVGVFRIFRQWTPCACPWGCALCTGLCPVSWDCSGQGRSRKLSFCHYRGQGKARCSRLKTFPDHEDSIFLSPCAGGVVGRSGVGLLQNLHACHVLCIRNSEQGADS